MSDHLLVVDNDEAYVAMMSLLFRDNGYAVDTAISGKEAIEKVRANPHCYSLATYGPCSNSSTTFTSE